MSGASDAIGVIEERTKGMKLGEIWDKYGVQIIAAALVLVLGFFLAKFVGSFIRKYFTRRDAAGVFTKFTVGTVKFVIYFIVLLLLYLFGFGAVQRFCPCVFSCGERHACPFCKRGYDSAFKALCGWRFY